MGQEEAVEEDEEEEEAAGMRRRVPVWRGREGGCGCGCVSEKASACVYKCGGGEERRQAEMNHRIESNRCPCIATRSK